ncbi:hypothetical protein [Micromonospora chokoriensis]
MTQTTEVNPVKLREYAEKIKSLLEPHQSAFSELAEQEPHAGDFETANWVEDIFLDRRDGVIAHVKHLQQAFDEMADGLIKIANDFEDIDANNGDAVGQFVLRATDIVDGMQVEYEPVTPESHTYDPPADQPGDTHEDPLTINFNEGGDPTVFIDPNAPGMDDVLDVPDVLQDDDLDLRDAFDGEITVPDDLPPVDDEEPRGHHYTEVEAHGRTYRQYEGQQDIWWYNNRPYRDTDGDGSPAA